LKLIVVATDTDTFGCNCVCVCVYLISFCSTVAFYNRIKS